MAFLHGKGGVVAFGAYDLSVYLNELTVPVAVDMAETTTFGKDDKTYIPGLRDTTMSLSGLFDGSANAIDDIFNSVLGGTTATATTAGIGSGAVGSVVRMMSAHSASYEVSSPVGDVVSASVELGSADRGDTGRLLHAFGTITAGGNDTGVDNTTSSTDGGVAHLHVITNSHDGNLVVKVQHSTDNSTWADLVTFTTVATTITTSQRSEVAAGTTVNRYLRALYTMSGSTGSVSFLVAFGRR